MRALARCVGALDISEAEFEEADLRRVPGHLVRRDRATQVIVTREKALRGAWRGLDLSRTPRAVGIEFMLERGDPDVVLVAPKRDRKYRDLLDGLKRLRDAGVAEPDWPRAAGLFDRPPTAFPATPERASLAARVVSGCSAFHP